MSRLDAVLKANPNAVAQASEMARKLQAGIATVPPAANAPLNERISFRLDEITKGGLKKPGRDLITQPYEFYHRLAWSNSATSFDFFNAGQSEFITNWPQSGQLPNTMGFAVARVKAWVDTGFTLATGAQDTAGAQAAATAFPMALAEMLRIIHENAKLKIWVGPRLVVDNFLVNFPRGCGPANVGAVANSNASTVNQIAFANNGAPADIHRDTFPDYFPIGPGESVQAKIILPSAYTLPNSAAGCVTLAVEGWKTEEAR